MIGRMEESSLITGFVATTRYVSVPIMGLFYGYIGWKHIVDPKFFLDIMPPFIPFPKSAVFFTGLWEIGVGVFLLHPSTRRYAALMAIGLLIPVFPVNINVCFDIEMCRVLDFSQLEAILRCFFQVTLVLIAGWHALRELSVSFGFVCSMLFYPTIFYFLTL